MAQETRKREYASPTVETLRLTELIEAVGPVQGLASGQDAAAAGGKDPIRTAASPRRSRGRR